MTTIGKDERMQMKNTWKSSLPRCMFAIGTTVLAAMTLTGCVSADEQRRADLYEDGGTCADFGAGYGSRSHTDCMLRQQDRRDHEQLRNMERARISSETARNNLKMLREMRRKRGEDG
jgi:hypothetical protein